MTSYTGSGTSAKQGWANGGMIFAATLMIVMGVYQIIVGIAAIVQDQFFIVAPNYTYEFDTTAWGWIHLGIGILAAVAGFFLYSGRTWAKAVAIALAVVSATANFFFIPYYPLWSLLIIAMDIFIIWAVATARQLPTEMYMAEGTAAGFGGETAQSRDRWPAENVAGGRHWAPEPAKEGTGTRAAEQTPEHAAAAARQAGQMPPSSTPPSNPPTGQMPPGTEPMPPTSGQR